ncbi:MAG TPA: hypothetical protein VFE58_00245, partial [Tepidisphaeraceae bacterium]|nr:hypothetical protein [Tepidisphaeraceae bacterium]
LSHTRLTTSGKPPILAEPVTGSITFTTSAPSLTAHPLLPNGVQAPPIPLTVQNHQATLVLSSKTLFYDISIP